MCDLFVSFSETTGTSRGGVCTLALPMSPPILVDLLGVCNLAELRAGGGGGRGTCAVGVLPVPNEPQPRFDQVALARRSCASNRSTRLACEDLAAFLAGSFP